MAHGSWYSSCRFLHGCCREMSLEALQELVKTNGNADLDPVIPSLVTALKDLSATIQAIEDLASCVFVQDVEALTLAVILPDIKRGLRTVKIAETAQVLRHPGQRVPFGG